MRRWKRLVGVVAVSGLLVVGCGDDADDPDLEREDAPLDEEEGEDDE